MNLSSAIENFLKYLQNERQAQPKTLENYQHYLKKFLEFAGDIPLSSIDIILIKKYRLHLANLIDPKSEKPLKKLTQNYFLIALRSFLRHLQEQGIEVLEAKDVRLGAAEKNFRKILEEEWVEKLLQAPDTTSKVGLRDKALLETLVSTGLKVSELAGLDRGAVNMGQKELVVVKRTGKRIVYFSNSASRWLEQYLMVRKDTFKPLFIRFQGKVSPKDDGKKMRLTPRTVQRIVEKYVQKAGIPVKATPSILRHSFAKGTLEKGEDLRSLQSHLGHQHLSSTQVYADIKG